jgi:hypothetical protein
MKFKTKTPNSQTQNSISTITTETQINLPSQLPKPAIHKPSYLKPKSITHSKITRHIQIAEHMIGA